MKVFLLLTLCAAFTFGSECPENPEKVVVCYYASWSFYREDIGKFNISQIDPTLCTHLVYTFAGLNLDSRIASLDSYTDIDQGSYKAFTRLKEVNPCLKTLLAIGGWNEGSTKYSVMAYTNESREAFADSVLRFLVTFDFDGIDVDWEYPTQRGGIDTDRDNFVELVKVLQSKLKIWNLIITMAVPTSLDINQKAYDVEKLAPYVDYVLLMGYDITSSVSTTTGLSSPLSVIKEVIDWWLQNLPASKLVLGVATYGRSFTLENPKNNGIGANATGPGKPEKYTKEAGFFSYYELLAKLATNRYTTILTEETTYYAYSKSEWITFDLEDTYIKKVEYALEMKLAGVMVWTIDTDDFQKIHSQTKYPVLSAINKTLKKK